MRRPTLAVLSLLLFAPSLVLSAPPEAPSHGPVSSHSSDHRQAPRPWRRLSDALIRRIWGLPNAQKHITTPHDSFHDSSPAPSGSLLARYGEDVVLRFNISTAEEAKALAEASDTLFLDVWEFNEDWADIRLAKDVIPSLLGLLPPSLHKNHVPLLHDLDLAQAILDTYPAPAGTQSHDDQRFSSALTSSQRGRGHPFFKDYQPLSVIVPWMSLMASMFTTHVRQINIGISYEGRDIPALRVGVHPTNNDQPASARKTILVTGGSHAREWISTSTVNYIAWSLINSYGKDRAVTRMLEAFDFVFVPTLNPDGYVYSWETDRLWRKNRQPTSLRFCRGVDLDRSFSYQWEGDAMYSNPCSESFPGDTPFDGVESLRFADWAKNETENNNVEFIGFLDLHSYSQQILYPYSFTCDQEPPTIEDLEELALGLAKAIRISRKGHPYKVSSACEGNVAYTKDSKGSRVVLPRIESTGGSALDWFYHEMRVKYAYQIKLRDTGSYGFLLPKENIVPTGEELLDAVMYFGRFYLGEVGLSDDVKLQRPASTQDTAFEKSSPIEHDDTDLEGEEQEAGRHSEETMLELRRKR